MRDLIARNWRQFGLFFLGSLAGLVIDLGGFALLTWLGVVPWIANFCSSVTSISVVYLLVTRYAFGAGTRSWKYFAFVGWYLANILVFSTIIQLLVSATHLEPFLWKICTIPVSFLVNYFFSRWLFRSEPA